MRITKSIRTGFVALMSVLSLSLVPLSAAMAVDPDTEAPVVSITSPTGGTTLKKNTYTNIVASVSDNVGVTQVDFYVKGATDPDTCSPEGCPSYLVCTGTSTTCAWKPTSRNLYELIAVAHDAAGNTTISQSVFVTVR